MSCRLCLDEVACSIHAAGHEAPLPSPVDDFPPVADELPQTIEYLRQLYDATANEFGRAVIDASQAGDAAAVMELLAQGSRLGELPDLGEGLLFLACLAGHLELVKALLTMQDSGDLARNNKCISMALHKAASGDHTDIVRLLILHSAEVNSRSPEGQLEVIRTLVEASANRENRREEMQTALLEAAMDGQTVVARLLIDNGAQVNMPAHCHESPLLLAACGGHVEVASLFIERGALIEEGNGDGSTPLMEAAREGRDDVVALLVAHGADVNAQCANGETPLTIACMSGFTDVVDILLQAGANLEHETSERMTPLMKAAHAGHHAVVQQLLVRGAGVNKCALVNAHSALSLACSAGHLDVAELLLAHRANPEHKLTDGSSALMEAIKGAHTAVATLLLEYPNVPTTCMPAASAAAAVPTPTCLHQSPAFSEESDKDSTEDEDDDQECDAPICLDDDEVSDHFDHMITSLISLMEESVDVLNSMSTAMRAGQEILDKLRCHKASGLATLAGDMVSTTQQASVLVAAKLDPARAYTDQMPYEEAVVSQLLAQSYITPGCGGSLPAPVDRATSSFDKAVGSRSKVSGAKAPGEQKLQAPTTLGELMAHHIQNSTVGGAMLPPASLVPSVLPDVCATSQSNKCGRNHTCDASNLSLLGLQADELTKIAEAAKRLGAPGSLTLKAADDLKLSAAKLPAPQQQQQLLHGKAACATAATHCKNACTHTLLPAASGTKPAHCNHTAAAGEASASGAAPLRRAAAGQGLAPQAKPFVDVNPSAGSNSDSPLTVACATGNIEVVRRLLEKKADIEHKDKKGFTPLLLAASAGHVSVIKLLLDSGANIEATTEKGKDSALGLAASAGRIEAAEVLVHRGANKEHRNASDYTPLCIAAGSGSLDMIRLLLAHGSEINSSTWTPESCGHMPKPNHKRQQKKAPKACLPGDPLCRQSAGKLGITPIMAAAMHGHAAAAKLLIENGCDINLQLETTRNTSLSLACIQRQHEVVRLLLDYSADVEHRSKNGLTPLMEAATNGSVEVGRVLIEHGADVNAAPVPTSKETALTIAADKGHSEFVKLLIAAKALLNVKNKKGCSPLWLACNGGHLSVVQSLCEAKADLESCDNRYVSCLMAAFKQGHVKVVKWLARFVTQFPSDGECNRHLAAAADKEELYKNCQQCMDVIMAAKEKQGAEANRHATILLKEIEAERSRDEKRSKAAAEKRDKKKQGRPTDKPSDQDGDQPPAAVDDDRQQQPLLPQLPLQQPPPAQPLQPRPVPSSAPPLDACGKPALPAAPAAGFGEAPASTSQPCSAQPAVPRNKVLDLSSIDRPSSAAAAAAAPAGGSRGAASTIPGRPTVDPPGQLLLASGTGAPAPQSKIDPAANAKNPAEVWLPVKKSSHSRNQSVPSKAPAHQASQPAAAARTSAAGSRAVAAPSPKKSRKEDGWKEVVRGNTKKISVPSSAAAALLSIRALTAIREWSGAGVELGGAADVGGGSCAVATTAAAAADRVVVLSGSAKAIRRAQGVFTALSQNPGLALESQLRKRRSRRSKQSGAAASQPGGQPPQPSPRSQATDDDMLVIPSATVAPFPAQPSSYALPPSGKPTYSTVAAAGVRPVAATTAAWQLRWAAPAVATAPAAAPATAADALTGGAADTLAGVQPVAAVAEPATAVGASHVYGAPLQRWNAVVAGTATASASSCSSSGSSSPQLSPRSRSREPATAAAGERLPPAPADAAPCAGTAPARTRSVASEPDELRPTPSPPSTAPVCPPSLAVHDAAAETGDDLPADLAAAVATAMSEGGVVDKPPPPRSSELPDSLGEALERRGYFGGSLAHSMRLPWLAALDESPASGGGGSEPPAEGKLYSKPSSHGAVAPRADPAKAPGFRPLRQLQPAKLFASTTAAAATVSAAASSSASSTSAESFAKAAYALLNGYGGADQGPSSQATSLMYARYGGGPTSLSEQDPYLGIDASASSAVRVGRDRAAAMGAAAAEGGGSSAAAAGQSVFSSKLNPNASEFRSTWSTAASYEPDFPEPLLYRQQWPAAREPSGLLEQSPLPPAYLGRTASASMLGGSHSPASAAGRHGRSDIAAQPHLGGGGPLSHSSYSYGIIGTERAQRRLAMGSRGGGVATATLLERDSAGDSLQHRAGYADLGFLAGPGDFFLQPSSNGPGHPNTVAPAAAAVRSMWSSATGGASELWGAIGEPLSASAAPPPTSASSGLRPGHAASSLRSDFGATAEQSRKMDSLLLGAPLQFNATPNSMYAMTASRGAGFGPTADQWNSLPTFAWDRTTPSSSR